MFQLADDFIDIKSSKKAAGKPTGKDQKKGKSTLISLIGYKKTYKYAKDLKNNILRKLSKHGRKAKYLMSSVEFILGRKF